MPIRSFDVFDTVLTRIFARPQDLFFAMAADNRSLSFEKPMDWAQFPYARIEAEVRARAISSMEDITLADIYTHLGQALGLDKTQQDGLLCREVELEKRSVRPVPPVLVLIEQARAEGHRIIFISDMYLPREVVRAMLESVGAFHEGDSIYISGEVGKTKHTGNLFRHAMAKEKVAPVQVHHIGDNSVADVQKAREIGILSSHFTETHLNRYEQTIVDTDVLPRHIRSQVAGASRLARLECPYNETHRRTIWDTGASVAGPLLTGYVAWLLSDAQRRGIERLYFIARDGQILSRIAKIICERLDLPIDCRYLYGSRQAWHLPAVTALGECEYGWIISPTDFLSIRMILRRIDVAPHEVERNLTQIGFTELDWDSNLLPDQRQCLSEFIRSSRWDDIILEKAAQKRRPAFRYLEQEGLVDCVPYAVVDIGWNGRLQRSLGNILDAGGAARALAGYYFGLRSRIDPRPQDELRAYFWDHLHPSITNDIGFKTRVMMEIFSSADHGGVCGYEMEGEQVIPVLLSEDAHRLLEWGVTVQQEAIKCFVENLDSLVLKGLTDPVWKVSLARLLEQFYNDPTLAEAQTYGKYPVAEDQNAAVCQPLASAFTVRDIPRALKSGIAAHHHNEWRQAAKKLTPWPEYAIVRLTEKGVGTLKNWKNLWLKR